MQKIIMFRLKYCGFCRHALELIEEAKRQYPEYRDVEIECVDEAVERERARQHDYYYVPTFYIGTEKIHEGPVGFNDICGILQRAATS
jgi:thioredoxin 1